MKSFGLSKNRNWNEKIGKTADTLFWWKLFDNTKKNNLSSFQSTKEQINRTVHHWKVCKGKLGGENKGNWWWRSIKVQESQLHYYTLNWLSFDDLLWLTLFGGYLM